MCAGQNLNYTIQTSWGFTFISRFRTVVSPPFPAALCHGILEPFCFHSSIFTAGDRRALHTVPAVRNHPTHPCLLISDLLYSHTTPSSWLILLGLHHLALYRVGSCCNQRATNVHYTYFQRYLLSDLWLQLVRSPELGPARLQRAVVQLSGAASSVSKAGRWKVGQWSLSSVPCTAFWAAGQHSQLSTAQLQDKHKQQTCIFVTQRVQ